LRACVASVVWRAAVSRFFTESYPRGKKLITESDYHCSRSLPPGSGDSGVRINARARGIVVVKLGDDDLLPRLRTPQHLRPQSDEYALNELR
jgi:hypothetical protein